MQVRVWFKSSFTDGREFAMEGVFIELVDNRIRFQTNSCNGPISFSVVDDPDLLRIEFIR